MATVYKFNVSVVSAFLAHPQDKIADIIADALKNYVDEETGLKLESVVVTSKQHTTAKRPRPLVR